MKLFYHFDVVPLKDAPSKFSGKVYDFHRTDDGEPSEKAHGSSNCRKYVYNLRCPINLFFGDSVKGGSVKIDSHKP